MHWNGKLLTHREDWEWALCNLRSADEAKRLVAEYAKEQPEHCKGVIAYLLGEIGDVDKRDEIEDLLGLVYPMKGNSSSELLLVGFLGVIADQPWFTVVMQIPRRAHPLGTLPPRRRGD